MKKSKDETKQIIIELWCESNDRQSYIDDKASDIGDYAFIFYGRIKKNGHSVLSNGYFPAGADRYQVIKGWVKEYEDIYSL